MELFHRWICEQFASYEPFRIAIKLKNNQIITTIRFSDPSNSPDEQPDIDERETKFLIANDSYQERSNRRILEIEEGRLVF